MRKERGKGARHAKDAGILGLQVHASPRFHLEEHAYMLRKRARNLDRLRRVHVVAMMEASGPAGLASADVATLSTCMEWIDRWLCVLDAYEQDDELVEIATKVLATRFSTAELACVATLIEPLAAVPTAQRSAQILQGLAVQQLASHAAAPPRSPLGRGSPKARHEVRVAAACSRGSHRTRARH